MKDLRIVFDWVVDKKSSIDFGEDKTVSNLFIGTKNLPEVRI